MTQWNYQYFGLKKLSIFDPEERKGSSCKVISIYFQVISFLKIED
jgi:hypothetical protein